MIEVGELTVSAVADVVPNETAMAPARLVPVMVTEVPPASGPEFGLTKVTAGEESAKATCTVAQAAAAVVCHLGVELVLGASACQSLA
jgi:hypothetical protein